MYLVEILSFCSKGLSKGLFCDIWLNYKYLRRTLQHPFILYLSCMERKANQQRVTATAYQKTQKNLRVKTLEAARC